MLEIKLQKDAQVKILNALDIHALEHITWNELLSGFV